MPDQPDLAAAPRPDGPAAPVSIVGVSAPANGAAAPAESSAPTKRRAPDADPRLPDGPADFDASEPSPGLAAPELPRQGLKIRLKRVKTESDEPAAPAASGSALDLLKDKPSQAKLILRVGPQPSGDEARSDLDPYHDRYSDTVYSDDAFEVKTPQSKRATGGPGRGPKAAASRAKAAGAKAAPKAAAKGSKAAPKGKAASKAAAKDGAKKPATPRKRKPAVKRKAPSVVVVEPPEFCPIVTDLDEEHLQARLFVRDFVFRFEKHCNLPLKHINIINDVAGNWTDVTFKGVALAVLRLLYSDLQPLFSADLLKYSIKEIEKTASDNDKIWHMVLDILSSKPDVYVPFYANHDPSQPVLGKGGVENPRSSPDFDELFDDSPNVELEKLNIVSALIIAALSGNYVRETIEMDNESMRRKMAELQDQLRTLKGEHAAQLLHMQQMAPPDKTPEWDKYLVRLDNAHARFKREIFNVKQEIFRTERKLAYRNMPLGMDARGNMYWLFSERSKTVIGWGSWIMCCKAEVAPSPTGRLIFPKKEPTYVKANGAVATPVTTGRRGRPPKLIPVTVNDTAPADDDKASSDIDDDVLLGENTNWYAIKTLEDAKQLSKWIRFSADYTFRRAATSGKKKSKLADVNDEDIHIIDSALYCDDWVHDLYETLPDAARLLQNPIVESYMDGLGRPEDVVSPAMVEDLIKAVDYISEFLPPRVEPVAVPPLPA
ncbi:uncharacterized protein V1510DRAFT_404601 [Dipodascopsis tothii]|uniref:uncharacterized protein n=1 Tax=Dipodascopsis tothii TaxID=44089 RepID=UPI0034CFC813